jgi:hypothetical protein
VGQSTVRVAPGGDLGDWAQHRADLRSEAADAVKLAQARMKLYYDKDHLPPKFGDRAYLRLSKKSERGYHLQNQTKLSFTRAGPFDIVRAHRPLAFELRQPDWLRIHPVISVEHLEPAPVDPFNRPQPEPGPIHVDGEERYIIEDILDCETRRAPGRKGRQTWYKVKWLGYDATTHCQVSSGPWMVCVTVPEKLSRSCDKCHYGSEGVRCSLRKLIKQGKFGPYLD